MSLQRSRKLVRYLLLLPGLSWATVLITTTINAGEGWWLITTTGLLVLVTAIREEGLHGKPYLFVAITFVAASVPAVLLLANSDVVVFIHGGVLAMFAATGDPLLGRGTRVLTLLVGGLLAGVLTLMLLAAWGMSH